MRARRLDLTHARGRRRRSRWSPPPPGAGIAPSTCRTCESARRVPAWNTTGRRCAGCGGPPTDRCWPPEETTTGCGSRPAPCAHRRRPHLTKAAATAATDLGSAAERAAAPNPRPRRGSEGHRVVAAPGRCVLAGGPRSVPSALPTQRPPPGLVASGGGTADRHIKFWNVNSGHMLNSVDAGSQVCNLAWSRSVNEVVSTHGFSLNQVVVWKYPTMNKLATLTGHSYRCAAHPPLPADPRPLMRLCCGATSVLYLAMSPDGQTVVTGAGDETLRFWNLFPSMSGGRSASLSPATQLPGSPGIR